MIPDDAYLHTLQGTIEGLRYWVPSIADVAHVAEGSGQEFWHLAISPNMPGGCPFELLLRNDRHYDIVLAGESYEYLPVTALSLFLPLAQAIIDGHVVQRRWASRWTGQPHAVETLVQLPDGTTWQQGRSAPETCEGRDHHFLPYHR